ncbi:MAG TPA: lamin tail domain-containing protein [Mycobacteriales bacterium]|nr:lamin tail domain-containing protein [Mycobacteriales bacterium]
MNVFPSRRAVATCGTAVIAAVMLVTVDNPAAAASPDVLVSQVYGGGGNSGATLTNDFIQLYNGGTAPVDLTGWSVQYAAAAGSTWQVTALSDTLAPGGYYLVQEAAGAGGTTPLPTPNATGSIAMSATAGKVALVTNATALTAACGATCHAAAGVRDYVGYGTAATDFEGTGPTGTLSNTTAARRLNNGTGPDTDNNAADFAAGPPVLDTGPPPPPTGTPAKIHDIQGAGHISPLVEQKVIDVTGIVTAKTSSQFWVQDPVPDADPATSEGIVVFGSTAAATVAVGNAVTVAGTVQEFRPGSTGLSITEIGSPTVVVSSAGNPLPAATLVGPGGRVPPGSVIEDDATGEVETSGTFDPATDGIDFWESMEGMLVELDDPRVVGPTQTSFGETPVVPAGSGVRTTRGGIVAQAGDLNPERVVVDDALASVPAANVGDSFAGPVVGVLSYNFGNFFFLPTASPTLHSGGLARETTRTPRFNELAVATFNVENLSPLDPQAKFDTLAGTIVRNLAAPDLVALEEIQDNTGPVNDGVVAADQTLRKLVDAITAAGGPAYQWREIDPTDGTDGGQPGGNIRQALLFRTDRGLSFVDRPGGDALTPASVVTSHGRPQLSVSPGRIDPTNAAWTTSRKPLVGELRWWGLPLFVVANHFNSKGGDDPLFGHRQPPVFPSETQRHQQAAAVRSFVDSILAVQSDANVVVLGDINDFDFSETTNILVGTGATALTDLPRTLPVAERYTYDFEGNSEVLDHILISRGLSVLQPVRCICPRRYDYDVVHVNSEFNDQASDHEPQVVRLVLNLF